VQSTVISLSLDKLTTIGISLDIEPEGWVRITVEDTLQQFTSIVTEIELEMLEAPAAVASKMPASAEIAIFCAVSSIARRKPHPSMGRKNRGPSPASPAQADGDALQ
jgi:hypothetical protein